MTASELIERLRVFAVEHGDVPVTVRDPLGQFGLATDAGVMRWDRDGSPNWTAWIDTEDGP